MDNATEVTVVKIDEANGAVLDWLVATSLSRFDMADQILARPMSYTFRASTDFGIGGQILFENSINTFRDKDSSAWLAGVAFATNEDDYVAGPTPLIAGLRCLVMETCGLEATVPASLLNIAPFASATPVVPAGEIKQLIGASRPAKGLVKSVSSDEDARSREAAKDLALKQLFDAFDHVRQYLPLDEKLTKADRRAVIVADSLKMIFEEDVFTKPSRAVGILSRGGIMEVFADPSVDLATFDWQDYEAETDQGKRDMAIPSRFADIAPPDTPLKFVFDDTRLSGNPVTVEAVFGYYQDGSPSIRLVEESTGEPWSSCSTAFPVAPNTGSINGEMRRCIWIKEGSENAGMTQLLVSAGILDSAWAASHKHNEGHASEQLLTEQAQIALLACDQPRPVKKKPSNSLGM